MLIPGDRAPEFDAPTSRGDRLKLSQLRGARVVLYFFPRAGSMGCTRESKEFAHHYPALRERGVEVVGVSVDRPPEQRAFAEGCSLPFPLVSDSEKEIARSYGVLGAFGYSKRVTFLIDAEGRITDVVESMLPRPHVDRALRAFLSEPRSTTPPTSGGASTDPA